MSLLHNELNLMLNRVALSAFAVFGDQGQFTKAIEELSELTQVLCKRLNKNPHVTDEQIIDEIADVLVIVGQLRRRFGDTEVDNRMFFKLERTSKFIENVKKVGSEL